MARVGLQCQKNQTKIFFYIIEKDIVSNSATSKCLHLNPHFLFIVISLDVSPTLLTHNYLHLPVQLQYFM